MRIVCLQKAVITTALLAGLTWFSGCRREQPITYRLVLPDRYVGWVKIDFAVNTAPHFDANNTITFRVGKDGTCRTDSLLVYSVPTKYEFLYDTPEGLRPVRDDYV